MDDPELWTILIGHKLFGHLSFTAQISRQFQDSPPSFLVVPIFGKCIYESYIRRAVHFDLSISLSASSMKFRDIWDYLGLSGRGVKGVRNMKSASRKLFGKTFFCTRC